MQTESVSLTEGFWAYKGTVQVTHNEQYHLYFSSLLPRWQTVLPEVSKNDLLRNTPRFVKSQLSSSRLPGSTNGPLPKPTEFCPHPFTLFL